MPPLPTAKGVGWGATYLADTLATGIEEFDPDYRLYLSQSPSADGEHVSDPLAFFIQRSEEFATLIQRSAFFDDSLLKKALGPTGLSGDDHALQAVAGGLIELYASFIHWGLSLRSTVVPPEWVAVSSALADYPRSALLEIREFSRTLSVQVGSLLGSIRAGEAPGEPLRVGLTLTVDDAAQAAFGEAIMRVQTKAQ